MVVLGFAVQANVSWIELMSLCAAGNLPAEIAKYRLNKVATIAPQIATNTRIYHGVTSITF
jgi:hypothetical protein